MTSRRSMLAAAGGAHEIGAQVAVNLIAAGAPFGVLGSLAVDRPHQNGDLQLTLAARIGLLKSQLEVHHPRPPSETEPRERASAWQRRIGAARPAQAHAN